ncbi:Uncharacterised protein [Mycobacteroides abscessus subsp. abscessus]|nr:Uncharacterised protein [Mycobacteroides abscessus subsp. abscessus]
MWIARAGSARPSIATNATTATTNDASAVAVPSR